MPVHLVHYIHSYCILCASQGDGTAVQFLGVDKGHGAQDRCCYGAWPLECLHICLRGQAALSQGRLLCPLPAESLLVACGYIGITRIALPGAPHGAIGTCAVRCCQHARAQGVAWHQLQSADVAMTWCATQHHGVQASTKQQSRIAEGVLGVPGAHLHLIPTLAMTGPK